jgi:hypothetical protein
MQWSKHVAARNQREGSKGGSKEGSKGGVNARHCIQGPASNVRHHTCSLAALSRGRCSFCRRNVSALLRWNTENTPGTYSRPRNDPHKLWEQTASRP